MLLLVLLLVLAACQGVPAPTGPAQATPEPTTVPAQPAGPTVVVTSTPEPVATEVQASVATATSTDLPTATSEPPTATPEPTSSEPTLTPTPAPTRAPKSLKETDNYLVLGMDARPGDKAWRTDTIMIVAVDHDANQIGIFSIPRDLWVDIPTMGPGRINQADYHGETAKYPGGGPALVGKIIEDIFGVPTNHWVRIKQEGLVETVDALGGVDITLNCALHEITPDPQNPNKFVKFDLPAGKNHLDGPTAKKFATYRYNSNDFYRGQRQQQLIWAIKERALQVDAITKLPQLWTALQHTFTTDLSILDVIRLARIGATLKPEQIHGLTFSTDAIVYANVGAAQVLKIGDKALLIKELDSLWSQKSISEQGKIGSNANCPTPAAPPTATITPMATLAPVGTATP
jgi:polyisoprenyl-teichoic acid--peptidoglycan teichoic acid transferase